MDTEGETADKGKGEAWQRRKNIFQDTGINVNQISRRVNVESIKRSGLRSHE